MPSAEFALSRKPDSIVECDAGQILTWENATDAEYNQLDAYLAGYGCTVENVQVSDNTISVDICHNGKSIILSYDRNKATISITYPEGTRPEREATAKASEGNVLPSLREFFEYLVEMPTMRNVLLREPTEETALVDGTKQIKFTDVTEEDFNKFSEYLDTFGCTLESYDTKGNVFTATLGKDGKQVTFSYGNQTCVAILNYPEGTVEKEFDVAAARDLKYVVGELCNVRHLPANESRRRQHAHRVACTGCAEWESPCD